MITFIQSARRNSVVTRINLDLSQVDLINQTYYEVDSDELHSQVLSYS